MKCFIGIEKKLEDNTMFYREPVKVNVLDSGWSGPGLIPGLGHCVVFLNKTLFSLTDSLCVGILEIKCWS